MSDFPGGLQPPNLPPPPPNFGPPPGYVAYGGPNNGAFSSYERIGGIARTLGILVTIVVPLLVVTTALRSYLESRAKDYLAGRIDESQFRSSNGLYGLVSLVVAGLTLAIVVLTMIWMNKLAKNQQRLNRTGTWGPGWAIGGWFVPPCVLYVVPYLMFRDLWKSSDPDATHDWRTNPVAPIISVWWVLYGLAPIAFLTVTVGSFKFGTNTADAARNLDKSGGITLISGIVQIAAAVSYLVLVRQLSARQMRVTNESA
ncbi:MAG TPA: DUF4328 domain-containing protein [Ilumatobacteraceae bacterium]